MNKKNDRKLIILSVLVAIIMWAFVMTTTNPSLSKTVRNVPLTIKNQENLQQKGYALVGKDEISSVNVRVEGSRSDLVGLSSEDLVASVDLGSPSEGIKTLDVKVDGPSGIKVEDVNPSNINFKIEKIVNKTLPVEVEIDEDLKDSKIIEITEQAPKEIEVSGLRKDVDRVDRIVSSIDDEKYLDGKIHNLGLKPLDKDGKTVENVELSTNSLSISFDVLQTKEVKVKLDVKNEIPGAMEIKEAKINPQTVVIKGDASTIDDIDEIKTEKLDLAEIKTLTYKENLKLVLPEGVGLNDNDGQVEVSVKISK